MSGFIILCITHKVQSFRVHSYKQTHMCMCIYMYIKKHTHMCVYVCYMNIYIYIKIHMATVLVLIFKNALSSMREFIKRRPCSTIFTNIGSHVYHGSIPQSILNGLQGLEIPSCTACSPRVNVLIHTPHSNS